MNNTCSMIEVINNLYIDSRFDLKKTYKYKF